ncbi:MAG: hypothetical protein IAE91_04320 [Ignavibacteriaceae bacterium]|nr:hypothetical protein [Ignavibacteriaceae bacterium]
MKLTFLFVISLLIFVGCSSNEHCEKEKPSDNKQPATIVENSSKVTASVISITKTGGNEYSIRIKVDDSNDYNNMPSIAEKGALYNVVPAFAIDESGQLTDSERNKRLLEGLKLEENNKIEAVIMLDNDFNWYIYDLIKVWNE